MYSLQNITKLVLKMTLQKIENNLKIIIYLLKIFGLASSFFVHNYSKIYSFYSYILFIIFVICFFHTITNSLIFASNMYSIINMYTDLISIVVSFLTIVIQFIFIKKYQKILKNLLKFLNVNFKIDKFIVLKQFVPIFLLIMVGIYQIRKKISNYYRMSFSTFLFLHYSRISSLIYIVFIQILIDLLNNQFQDFNKNIFNYYQIKKIFKKFFKLLHVFNFMKNLFALLLIFYLLMDSVSLITYLLTIFNWRSRQLNHFSYLHVQMLLSMFENFLRILSVLQSCTNISNQVCYGILFFSFVRIIV